jgi:hypothetical protein
MRYNNLTPQAKAKLLAAERALNHRSGVKRNLICFAFYDLRNG